MIEKRLFEMQDLSYRDFHSRLMPDVPKDKIIGVRTPLLRAYAKEIKESEKARDFIYDLPHKYYEEYNLHAFLIEYIKDFDECINEITRLLPYIDNWATCDCMNPRVLKKYPDRLLCEIEKWLASDRAFTVRYGIKKLMDHFLDENFKEKYYEWVLASESEEYYVKMMKAWYFATALAKQYDTAIVCLKEERLPVWEHNKTIQKAVESYRISEDKKELLRAMRKKV